MERLKRILRKADTVRKITQSPSQAQNPTPPAPIANPAAKPEPPRIMLSRPAFADPPKPIFIIGAPRSGTSITTWALGQHPNIQPMPETAWIAVMSIAVQQAYGIGSERGKYSHLSNVGLPPDPFFRRMGEAIDNIVNDVFEERCTRLHGDWRNLDVIKNDPKHPNPELLLRRRSSDPKKRWIDGTPLNSMFSYGISMLFPDGRFLHLLREPHEVVASLASFDTVGGKAHAINDAIQNWLDHTRVAYIAQKALGAKRVYTARFEQLSSAPEELFRGILNFLEEPWSDDCLAPLEQKINSSQVDDEREKVRAALAGNQLYQTARRLYDEIIAYPLDSAPCEAALAELRNRHVAEAMARRLIG